MSFWSVQPNTELGVKPWRHLVQRGVLSPRGMEGSMDLKKTLRNRQKISLPRVHYSASVPAQA